MTAPAREPFALFENNHDADGTGVLLEGLAETIAPARPDELATALAQVEARAQAGAWVATAFPYALGFALEPRLIPRLAESGQPLFTAWVFERATTLDREGCEDWLHSRLQALSPEARAAGLADLQATMAFEEHERGIERIRAYVAAGDVYQVNFTFPMVGVAYGDPLALYAELRRTQPARYGGVVCHPDGWILSRSPELFVERHGTHVTTRPMKGTAPASAPAQTLAASVKDRAENVMIVDLIRNDLGRLVPPGGVRVASLFDVERYPTVWQMTSTIEAAPVTARLEAILRALFPCGSVTGAPKIRAMEIIDDLEPTARGLYCGALGWIAPGGDFRWNVAIRTLTLDHEGNARLGVGSGVTHDSTAAGEWAECLVKARFAAGTPSFDLFETLLVREGEVPWLQDHLDRLRASARWFGFACDVDAIARDLLARARLLGAAPHRLRLSLRADGVHRLESAPLPPLPSVPTVVLSAERVAGHDGKSRHKTTARALYDRELARVIAAGHFDALFLNAADELVEGARSNVILEIDARLVTPPLASGALAGVMRGRLLREGRVQERRLDATDLARADRVFLSNALRGLFEVRLVADASGAPASGARP